MLSKFDPYTESGLIKKQVSPCGKLVLFDYTEKCQFERAWDEVTLNARGSVYELKTGRIVARAFPKFFNWSELPASKQDALLNSKNFSVYEKLDGSLGIIYYYEGKWRVNTRGSFTSDQAIKGKQILANLEYDKLSRYYTYLVEIIYPENRIVVDYKGEEKLVLLASYETETGVEVPALHRHVFKETTTLHDLYSIQEVLDKLKTLSYNEEGYVVRFPDGTRAKFKGDEYVKMHRIVTGISPLVLWESMEQCKVSEELLASIPEEFREVYETMSKELNSRAEELLRKAYDYSNRISVSLFGGIFEPTPHNRKMVGLYLKENDNELNQYVFPILLGNTEGVYEMVRKAIKPKGNIL